MESEISIKVEKRRREDLERNARKLKRWMKDKTGEIRMGIKQAEEMNFDFSDEGIVALYEHGIFVDVIIRNVKEDDYLPDKLMQIAKIDEKNLIYSLNNENKEVIGFVKAKIIDVPKEKALAIIDIINLFNEKIPDYDFTITSFFKNGEINDFMKIRITRGDKILSLQEIKKLFYKIMPSNDYEFHVENIKISGEL